MTHHKLSKRLEYRAISSLILNRPDLSQAIRKGEHYKAQFEVHKIVALLREDRVSSSGH